MLNPIPIGISNIDCVKRNDQFYPPNIALGTRLDNLMLETPVNGGKGSARYSRSRCKRCSFWLGGQDTIPGYTFSRI